MSIRAVSSLQQLGLSSATAQRKRHDSDSHSTPEASLSPYHIAVGNSSQSTFVTNPYATNETLVEPGLDAVSGQIKLEYPPSHKLATELPADDSWPQSPRLDPINPTSPLEPLDW
ncbi:hypothetical protein NX059_011504 [Plenodomus lindquistii]|nr:hypothetical protein NX059_011504 [Plenodomus lindquistii]